MTSHHRTPPTRRIFRMNLSPSRFLRAGVVCLGLCLSVPVIVTAESEPAAPSATDLAARLSAKQQDGTAYVRMRLEISGGPKPGAVQIQGKSRSTGSGTELVYQVLWPKERKGEAVLLRRSGNRAASGTLFTPPDTTRPLDASQLREPFFGSDLAYEDVIENFFGWSQQNLVGTETVDNVPCQILESKPGKGESSLYASVRTWVDTRRLVPLRVEKYGGSGGNKLVRRIETTRVVNDDKGRAIPANLAIRGPGGDSTTQLDGGKITHAISFTDAEFTPEGIKQTSIPRGGSPE